MDKFNEQNNFLFSYLSKKLKIIYWDKLNNNIRQFCYFAEVQYYVPTAEWFITRFAIWQIFNFYCGLFWENVKSINTNNK